MALVPATLKSDLLSLFKRMKDSETSEDDYAGRLSEIIDRYVKTATVTVGAGIPVSTAGSAGAQTGATTAPGTGSLS
jgi:hypothetical protein